MHELRVCAIATAALLSIGCKAGESRAESSAAATATPVFAVSTKSEEARKHLVEGEHLVDEGRYLKAYEQFKRSVAADSAFAFGYLRTAQWSQSFGEYKANLERAYAYEASANPTEHLLIEIERKSFDRDVQGAIELSRQLVQKEPSNPRAWWVLAGNQQQAGQTAESRASYRKALDVAPGYGLASLFLGRSYAFNEPRDFASGEKYIEQGVKLWPEVPVSYLNLGDLRRNQGRLDEALTAYTRQIELDPQDSEAHAKRGNANIFLGNFAEARSDYDVAIRLGKGNEPAYQATTRAWISTYAGHPDSSLLELEQVIPAIDGMGVPEPDGIKLGAMSTLLIIAEYNHRFDVADRWIGPRNALYLKFLEKNGTPDVVRQAKADNAFEEGRLAAFKGQFSLARQKAAEFMKLVEPDRNPTKNRNAHLLLGLTALFEKKYAEAITELEQADPDDPYPWYFRALALEGAGRAAESKALFKKVAAFGFNQPGFAAVRVDAIARAK